MLLCFKYLVAFLLVYSTGHAQSLKKETLTNQGSSHIVYANNKSYFLQESIGQASVIRTYDTEAYSLRQGFLQPIDASVLNSDQSNSLDAIVFPNPFTQQINVQFNEPVFDVLNMRLSDLSGRTILTKDLEPSQSLIIPLYGLTNGIYLLTISMRQKEFMAKLIKK